VDVGDEGTHDFPLSVFFDIPLYVSAGLCQPVENGGH
jgi:hypothetical protein